MAGWISSVLLLLPHNRAIAQSLNLSVYPSLSVLRISLSLSLSLCPQLVTVAVSSKSQDEGEIGAVAWPAGAGNPRLPDAHLLICEGATVGGWQGMVELDTANGSSSSVPAAVGPGAHRQGWGTSESVSLAASQPVGTMYPGTVYCSSVAPWYSCVCMQYPCTSVLSLLLPQRGCSAGRLLLLVPVQVPALGR